MILKNFVRLIIPVSLNEDDKKKITEAGCWERTRFNLDKLYDDVKNKHYQEEGKINSVQTFVLNDNCRKKLVLPKDNRTEIVLSQRNNIAPSILHLDSIHIHFFEEYTGLFDFEFSILTNDIKKYINAIYFLSETYDKPHKMTFEDRISKDEVKKYDFDLFEIINRFCKRSKDNMIKTPFVYVYDFVLLDEKHETFMEDLNLLKNVFKPSYNSVIDETEFYSAFNNSYWGFSEYATTNISFLTDDEITSKFFTDQFPSICKEHYLYLFLVAIYRKMTLSRFLVNLDERIYQSKTQVTDIDKEQRLISQLIKQYLILEAKTDYIVVSYEMHINAYYQKMLEAMRIKDYSQSVDQKIKDVQALTDLYSKEILEDNSNEMRIQSIKESVRKNRLDIIIYLVTQIIGSFAILKTAWEMTEKISGQTVMVGDSLFYIPLSIALLFFGFILWQLILKIQVYNKIKREIRL